MVLKLKSEYPSAKSSCFCNCSIEFSWEKLTKWSHKNIMIWIDIFIFDEIARLPVPNLYQFVSVFQDNWCQLLYFISLKSKQKSAVKNFLIWPTNALTFSISSFVSYSMLLQRNCFHELLFWGQHLLHFLVKAWQHPNHFLRLLSYSRHLVAWFEIEICPLRNQNLDDLHFVFVNSFGNRSPSQTVFKIDVSTSFNQ